MKIAEGLTADSPVSEDIAATIQDGARWVQLFQPERHCRPDHQTYPEDAFDLQGLDGYKPRHRVSGWLKIAGTSALTQGRLARLWEREFTGFHPEVNISFNMVGKETALAPLYYHQADIAFIEELGFYDELPYERALNAQPLDLPAITGSADLAGFAPPFKVIVHSANPLAEITVDQLDGVFGSSRTGGWDGAHWDVQRARGPEGNVRTWGQLGLGLDWSDRQIEPIGYSLRDPVGAAFSDRVMRGSDMWNEHIMTFGPCLDSEGRAHSAEAQIAQEVARNRGAIAFVLGGDDMTGVKVLAVAPTAAGSSVAPTMRSVQARTYPLSREVTMVTNAPGGRVEPLVEEFLRYVLSRDGQTQVVRDGKFLPLNREVIEGGAQKLDGCVSQRWAAAAEPASLVTQQRRAQAIADRGRRRMYPEAEFDLSDLPPYEAASFVQGWLRIHGNNYLETGPLGRYWEEGFQEHHPGAKFSWYLPTRAVGLPALYYDQADLLAQLSDATFGESVAYQKVTGGRQPIGVEVFTGSFDLPGWANTPVIIVNKNNPLSRISIEELDGIFGSARSGGWRGGVWHPEYGRGPDKNIRTWGQLGLGGDWEDAPINAYGFQLRYNTAKNFSDRVLQGSDKWAENISATGNYALPDGTRITGGAYIPESVESDRFGIAFTNYGEEYMRPGAKVLALADTKGGAYAEFTLDNVRNRVYPWVARGMFFFNQPSSGKINPLSGEFLNFVLSRDGQEAVVRDGKYLPLSAAVIARERGRLGLA